MLPNQFWSYMAEVMASGAGIVKYDPLLDDDYASVDDEGGSGTNNLEKGLQTW